MLDAEFRPQANNWLEENGSIQLEQIFRAITFRLSVPVLLADNDGLCRETSAGAGTLLGRSREEIIGHKIDEFADPSFRPQVLERWQNFLEQGQQDGTLQLIAPDGSLGEIDYAAKGSVLPARHLLILNDKVSKKANSRGTKPNSSCVQDYALFLLDAQGRIAFWYSGATRIYGYTSQEVVGRPLSFFCNGQDESCCLTGPHLMEFDEQLQQTATDGHLGTAGWQRKSDGSSFWANVMTAALKDDNGKLQGFARVVRDFTECRERDEKLQRNLLRHRLPPIESTMAAVAIGEFEKISEANNSFLKLIGFNREELLSDQFNWLNLTPPEYAALDGQAHEEALQCGACAPYEKELIRKDGGRVTVLVTTAILNLTPFRWVTSLQNVQTRHQVENIDDTQAASKGHFKEMVGNSPALKRILEQVEMVAPTDATVLLLGETGTGKELVARAIHRLSPRKDMPCITLNCAAIPTGLLESELFGYERGAFTGALSQKIGRFEMANRGTLFLDEVGDIPLDLQPKLLRALQEKSFERLGGTKTIPIDVRLVAATNRDLTKMMEEKLFRNDLFYRLKVFPITVPPLRDRPDDIPLLARHFTKKYSAKMNREIETIPTEAMRALVGWSWPGNVRELENFIERAVILSRGPNLRVPLDEIRREARFSAGTVTLEQIEREHIVRVFRDSRGIVTTAAIRLGLHRTTLNAMMRKLGISRSDL